MQINCRSSRGYYTKLQNLIEEMYTQNNQEKVTIVVHSMGGPVSLYFFTKIVSQEWKDQFINAYIPLSGAWNGGNKAVEAQVSGISPVTRFTFLFPGLLSQVRTLTRSFPSIAWFLPLPSIWGDQVLVRTPTRTYTANDYEVLF